MKKVLLLVLAMLTIDIADAQITIQQSKGSYEVIWKTMLGSRPRLVCFNLSNGEQYFTLGLTTTNQFDDTLTLYLGGIDEAKASLSTLGSLPFDEQKVYNLNDDRGEPFSLYRDNFGQYVIRKDGFAGNAYTTAAQLSKMLAALEEWQGKKE